MPDNAAKCQFASDNYAGICPEAWAGLQAANEGHAPAYGQDEWTRKACDLLREIFETDCEVFFTFSGTAANSLVVATLCKPYHSIIVHENAHIETDECGAPEFFSNGSKVLLVTGPDGKITPDAVEAVVKRRTDIHYPKPHAISLTQATELGTVYSVGELAALGERARALGLRVHMDGARLGNALVTQVDAALNSGNSGGPAVANGKLVGVASSRMGMDQRGGLIIPVEEIQFFLDHIQDGWSDGKPQILDSFQTVENEALRAKLGLEPGQGGAMVTTPYRGDEAWPLKDWDVITRIGDHEIGSDGKVVVREDLRLDFQYLVAQLEEDGKIPLTILRQKELLQIEYPVNTKRNLLVKYLKGQYPRYFIYGPLCFSVATQDLMASVGSSPMLCVR